ncbi:MFS transporter [Numidum massiliense]|uniref:MFS transporter n=1 Tax=Numidum massiliense TaxID=1522315 RepID=UPI000ACF3FA3|nr:MFS transporter [Numidum massiliense]
MKQQLTVTPNSTTIPSRRILILSGIGLLFDSMDIGLLSYVLVALTSEWHLDSTLTGVLASISFIGMAIGSAVAGSLADRYGRRNIFMWTLVVFSVATGLTALATTVAIFIVLRFITGLGLGGELPVATTYVLESSPEAIRGRRVVYLNSFYAFGSIAAALISFFILPSFGWRIVFVIGAIPALYAIVLRIGLPESPLYQSLSSRVSLGKSFTALWNNHLARRSLVTWTLWFVMNFTFYGMFLWLPSVLSMRGYSLVNSIGYVLVMTLAQVPGYLTAAWLVEKWGRKRTLITAMAGSALAALGLGFAQSTVWIIACGMLLSFFMLGSFAATYIFTVEQFPTKVRGSGMGWAAGFGRIGSIIAPFITGALINAGVSFPLVFAMFFAVMFIGFVVVARWGIETIGTDIRS